MADSDSTPPKPPIHWRELHALWPLLILDLLLLFILKRHFDELRGWIIGNVGGVLIAWLLTFLPKATVDSMKDSVANLLKSKSLGRAFKAAIVLVLIASAFVGSVHIIAKDAPAAPVTLHWVEASDSGETVVQSKVLDGLRPHRDFFVPMWPTGRKLAVSTSTHRRTPSLTMYPWSAPSLEYPGNFGAVVSVALLPAPDFLIGAQGNPLMVRVSEAGGQMRTLALDTLTDGSRLGARTVSSVTPPPLSKETRSQWLELLQTEAGDPDTTPAVPVVTAWMTHHRPIRSRRDLVLGDSLRIAVFRGTGDTIASQNVRLDSALSNVIVQRVRQ